MSSPTSMSLLSCVDERLVRFGTGGVAVPSFFSIHHAFESFAFSQPNAVAVEHLLDTITYSSLNDRANFLAGHLRTLGVGANSRVCILAERSIFFVVAIIAVLKAGGTYVPLDGGIVTSATLNHIIQDSSAAVVLVLDKFEERVQGINVPTVRIEDFVLCNSGPAAKPVDLSSPFDGAYIIYTSGTTGKPKGVLVTHSNVTNLILNSPGNLGMGPGVLVGSFLNIQFDMAAWEILGCLANGATLCMRGKTSKDWRATLRKVDIVIATPSILQPHKPLDYPNIRVVATAGEVCPQALADAWSASGKKFFNSCGPTEITIVNTMRAAHIPGTPLSIGKPTPNNNVYILDEDLKPVPFGVQGVMWAGGLGITAGYINSPSQTAERYKPDPFTNDGMMFNTGDLGRWREDGEIDHLGRIDDQVKVKGFRVEMDGVAAAMETCEGVRVAAALLIDDKLWGFLTPPVLEADVIAATSIIQPYYAVPTHYIMLQEFPLTANGKTDKRALLRLAAEKRDAEHVVEPVAILSEKDKTTHLALPPLAYLPALDYTKETQLSAVSSSLPSTDTVNEKGEGSTTTSVESGNWWDGYQEDQVPDKTHGHYLRNLRYQVFSLYRRLFGIVFVVNMSILIAVLVQGNVTAQRLGLIVVANLCCAILMRQDYVINAFFTLFCAAPTSWPLSVRSFCARVFHIGGLHSGCATSGLVWLFVFTIQATIEMAHKQRTSVATVVVTYLILLLLVGIVSLAHPKLRTKRHDLFERSHRFLGWSATAMVWVQVVLLTNDYKTIGQSLGNALVNSAAFWLVVVMTSSIILPWIRLRKVAVRAEVLSGHAVRLYFDYVTTKPGHFVRLSESPMMEWHGFACVNEPGVEGYSLVVSKAGDWTSKMINNPPTHLWVRGVPCYGVLRITTLFRRVVFVATGSGIGPCAPCILAQAVPIRLLWTSPNVRATFGDKLVDQILDASPGAVIYDTRIYGKPDMVKMTLRMVRDFNAEAVCIISNPKLTAKVVYGCRSRGIPAFGAIFDS